MTGVRVDGGGCGELAASGTACIAPTARRFVDTGRIACATEKNEVAILAKQWRSGRGDAVAQAEAYAT